jgi:hypothetical protein
MEPGIREIKSVGLFGRLNAHRKLEKPKCRRGPDCRHTTAPVQDQTDIPKSFPTKAVSAMAIEPQKQTRTAPRPAEAPPVRAATAPRAVKTMQVAQRAQVNLYRGTT